MDLLQFHWWDYNNPYYIDALKYLSDLKNKGTIKYIGLTNFDTEHMQIILDSDIPIISNQVQYSIIDRRPEVTDDTIMLKIQYKSTCLWKHLWRAYVRTFPWNGTRAICC